MPDLRWCLKGTDTTPTAHCPQLTAAQVAGLTTLPPSILGLVVGRLSPQEQGQLRLVCRVLDDSIRWEVKHAKTAARLSRTSARHLLQRFPS